LLDDVSYAPVSDVHVSHIDYDRECCKYAGLGAFRWRIVRACACVRATLNSYGVEWRFILPKCSSSTRSRREYLCETWDI